MKDKRKLTGKWYIKKTGFIFKKTKVMVQVKVIRWEDPTYGNGGAGWTPESTYYEEATKKDLKKLGIKIK